MNWLGERKGSQALLNAAQAIHTAVDETLKNPETRTADLGGKLGCKAFGERVAAAI